MASRSETGCGCGLRVQQGRKGRLYEKVLFEKLDQNPGISMWISRKRGIQALATADEVPKVWLLACSSENLKARVAGAEQGERWEEMRSEGQPVTGRGAVART